jgi:hypothetical protein
MKLIMILVAALTLSACGGGGEDPCPMTEWTTRVTDATGTYNMRCREFQCPGFKAERHCFRI